MQFSVSGAARLYGKQRKTLYRHMEAGRLSYQVLGSGQRALDLAELIRVYGEPPRDGLKNDTPSAGQGDTPNESLLLRAMLEELQALRREVSELKQQLALPAPQPAERRDSSPDSADTGHDTNGETRGEPVRNLDDVLARFQARTGRH